MLTYRNMHLYMHVSSPFRKNLKGHSISQLATEMPVNFEINHFPWISELWSKFCHNEEVKNSKQGTEDS